MKARKMRKLLRQMGYRPLPGMGQGSHTVLACEGRGNILFAYHDKETIPPFRVKSVLVTEAGMTVQEAREVLGVG